jgi:hypothetical protein
MRIAFWRTYESDWPSSGWSFTRIRRAGSSLAGSPKRTGNVEEKGKPETFDFLGFQHVSGKNQAGRFTVRRTTIRKRMRAKLRELKQELRRRMHDPVPKLLDNNPTIRLKDDVYLPSSSSHLFRELRLPVSSSFPVSEETENADHEEHDSDRTKSNHHDAEHGFSVGSLLPLHHLSHQKSVRD